VIFDKVADLLMKTSIISSPIVSLSIRLHSPKHAPYKSVQYAILDTT